MFIGQNNIWDTMDRISTLEAERIVKQFERRRMVRNIALGGAMAALVVGGAAWMATRDTNSGWLHGVTASFDQSSSVLTGAAPGAQANAGIQPMPDAGPMVPPTGQPSAVAAQAAAPLPIAEAPDPSPERPELVFTTSPAPAPAPAAEERTAAAAPRARRDRDRPATSPVAREAALDEALPAGDSPAAETYASDEAASDEITLEADDDDDEVPMGDVPPSEDLTPDLAAEDL